MLIGTSRDKEKSKNKKENKEKHIAPACSLSGRQIFCPQQSFTEFRICLRPRARPNKKRKRGGKRKRRKKKEIKARTR
jgi:hypothetical protein